MAPEKILPTVVIVISLMAAVVYLIKGNIPSFTYWFCAGMLNLSATYWM